MGVPALFRWLSKKYPKIVSRVVEDTPTKVTNDEGEVVEVPIRYEGKNPNGFEVDNLYLDMNGIVHPCTHPEGKPAPETEEEMMVEIFGYTERVVNMARPRKVLMMAIDGVAPRAKMNQQRSRRFRAAQEAHDKEIERQEAIKMFEAMGHPVSEETRGKKSWDSNAITPGTPFMDFLSISLKYWISHKLATDPGWKDLKIIISDSSVPGEGEHKIVDWIRRQRTYSDWDPNTSHVIYGLDADLIMLSLATHEPHFRVLREDVFAQGDKGRGKCKNCGMEDHIAANCLGEKPVADPNVVEVAKPVDPKPFIFLNVSILREYLAVELALPGLPFPFDLELAIDDWIFMIFFVGNDFLPHLPSLEIREGAIDMLLKIWKTELGRMGGYLTNHGKVNMGRAQVILEGLASNEDAIFEKRKADEDRQEDRNASRRRDEHKRQNDRKARESGTATPATNDGPGSFQMNGQDYVAVTPTATARGGPLHPSLPTRPGFDIVPKDEYRPPAKKGKTTKLTKGEMEDQSFRAAMKYGAGIPGADADNKDIIANRAKNRLANIDAAARLKAELEGREYVPANPVPQEAAAVEEAKEALPVVTKSEVAEAKDDPMGEQDPNTESPRGVKRAREEAEAEGTDEVEVAEVQEDDENIDDSSPDDGEDESAPNPDADADATSVKKKLKFNADGTVDGYVDDVRLWEPGYRERYYRSKFGVELSDTEFMSKITMHYMEGLCWVLEYYYQGVPAWDWYYPYHYAPFAQDFKDVGKLNIEFEKAEPFKPYGQLLGVFPAASRIHLPEPLQTLMINEDSPILDFYPEDFEIDMNGKKMQWQGVALLPFIDQHRLLSALASKEGELTEDEKRRNRWGDNVIFVGEGSMLYDAFCGLYGLKASSKPVPLDTMFSQGTSGSVLGIPSFVPNSAFDTPLPNIPECPDITNNTALSARYFFPRQAHSHRSVVLNGFRPSPAALSESDKDWVRRGGQRGGGGGRGGRGGHGGGGGPRHSGGPGMGGRHDAPHSHHAGGAPGYGGPPGQYGNGGGRHEPRSQMNGGQGYPPRGGYQPPAPPPQAAYGGGSYGGGSYGGGGGAYGGGYGGGGYGAAGAYAPPSNPYGYPAPPPRNPYAAPPPAANPFQAPPPQQRGRGGPPQNGAYGGYGGQPPAPGYGGSGYGGGGGGGGYGGGGYGGGGYGGRR